MTQISKLAFGTAIVLYLAAMIASFHHLAYRRRAVDAAARALAWGGVGVHIVSVVARGIAAGRVPWGNMYEYSSIVGLLVVAGALLLERFTRAARGFALAAAVLAMAAATLIYVSPGPLVPALESYWLRIHVVAAMLGSSLFILGAIFTVLFLVAERRERRRAALAEPAREPALVGAGGGLPEDYAPGADEAAGATQPRGRLPSPAVLDRMAYRTIAFGFPVWTFAVIAGAIWAERAWGRYWGWDPKEVWSFITWVVFAAYLHARATVGWRGRRAAVLALVGFGSIVFNLYVVNTAIVGLHSYAQ